MPEDEKSELIYEIARSVYVEGRTQREVAEQRPDIGSASSVSRLLRRGWKTGIITLGYNPSAAAGTQRNEQLEERLRSAFGLQNAIVVNFPYSLPEYRMDDDHRLHRALGRAAADHLKLIVRSRDHIGVGGGRTLYETALALREQYPLPLTGMKVTSLVGRLSHTSPEWTHGYHPFDADDVAFMLASAFADSTLQPISSPLILPKPDIVKELKRYMPGALLSSDNWEKAPEMYRPGVALTGVGSLHPEGAHAFRILMKSLEESSEEPLQIKPIAKALRELFALITPEYCPVGDVYNRLYWVPPPPGVAIDLDFEKTIRRKIDEIDARMLSVTLDMFRKIPKVIAVAGGPFKTDAIFALLTFEEPLVHELVTDRITAEILLERGKAAAK